MAARRRSTGSSRRGGGSDTASTPRASRRSSGARSRSRGQSNKNIQAGIRPNADGKFPVTCPKCSAAYNVPEEYLDQAVTCKHCKTAFTPRNALGRGQRTRQGTGGPPKGLIQAIIVMLLIVGVIIIYNAVVEKEPPKAVVTADTRRYLETGSEPFQVWQKLAIGVQKEDPQAVGTALAWADVWKKNKKKGDGSWALTTGEAKQSFKDEFTAGLFKGELANAFKMCEAEWVKFRSAVLWPEEVKSLEFEVYYPSRDRVHITAADAHIKVKVIEVNGNWKVDSWKVLHVPSPPRKKKKRIRHKTLKAPKWEEVTIKGKKMKAYQGEVVPMDHLETTPPDLRKEIDKIVDTIFTPNEDDPRASTRASFRLLDIGKPAVPRILNAFYERRPKTRYDVEAFNILMKAFNNLAGANIDFLPDIDPKSMMGGTEKDREILVKAAFGHWYWNFWKKEQDLGGETDAKLDEQMRAGPKRKPGRK